MEVRLTKQETADFPGVHKTTVYRELARNQDGSRHYNTDHAIRQNRRCQSNKVKARIGEGIWDTVEFQLRNGQWSPEQISNAREGTHRKKVVSRNGFTTKSLPTMKTLPKDWRRNSTLLTRIHHGNAA